MEAAAQTRQGPADAAVAQANSSRSAAATRVHDTELLRVDGVLDEDVWRRARWISDLRQREPDEGAPATLATEVAFLYDEAALYVGARLESPPRGRATHRITRRDEAGTTDRIVISLDTFRDGLTAYGFGVTAAGTRLDWFHPEDRQEPRDFTYDAVWEAKTERTASGWTAEVRIPFSQLRYTADRPVWGLNVSRFVPERNEESHWSLVPRDETGWASRFGLLRGLHSLARRRPLELRPFVAGETEVRSPGSSLPEDPFSDRVEPRVRAGLDLKLGLGPDFSLDGSVNPDFGQVEFDPAVVNLSAFETIFPERRPFFVEGNALLSGGAGPRLFFSRRIGAEPLVRPEATFSSVPDAVTILGATKLTGRTRSGLSLGALAAVTARENALTFDAVADTFGRVPVAPVTGWGAFRLQQELGSSASTVGLTGTAVVRDLEPEGPLSGFLVRRAFSGKADGNLRLRGGAWELGGHAGFSLLQAEPEALVRIQRSSAHYFQRPDQDHVRFDPDRSSLAGWTAGLRVSKNAGRWLIRGGLQADSPGLELNDVGQLFRGDAVAGRLDVVYRDTNVGPLFRNWSVTLDTRSGWNFGGVRRMAAVGLQAEATWPNFVGTSLRVSWLPATLSDDLTRGGPLMRRPTDWTVSGEVRSNPAATPSWSGSVFRGNRNFSPDWIFRFALELNPAARWRISLQPRYLRLENRLQYVTTLDDGPEATFGSRFVFARARVREFALPVRLAYAVSPDLGLDLVAEPFAAGGRFTEFGELAAARSSALRIYGTDGTRVEEMPSPAGNRLRIHDGATSFEFGDPDFRRLSFRTSLVLRWEWRPGSTLLLVWQGDRNAVQRIDDLPGPGALGDAFTLPGVDTLIVKISHWLPV